ncbi:retrovirus-related pol polyprotein from transposon TNT 1-94 [Tanacetum coccineum]
MPFLKSSYIRSSFFFISITSSLLNSSLLLNFSMSSSSKSLRDYSQKYQRAILEPWRQIHGLPPSPPSPPPTRTTPTSPISNNSLSYSSPSQNLTQNLNEIHHLSNLLDKNLQQEIKAINSSPPTLPYIPPPSLDQICLGVDLEPDEWIKDSGCSKHMTGNRKLFSSYKAYNGGYSQNSKAYIILNKHTRKVKESLNVTFDETPPPSKTSPLVDDDLDEEEAIKVTEKKNLENDIVDETLEIDKIVNIKESRNHPLENVIGNLNQRTLRSQTQNQSNFFCFISTIEPKNVNEALTGDSWIVAMQEELNQFIANDVWELVSQPRNMEIIETKWVFRNKLDENGNVSRNKAWLVAQGYNQQEGIDYDETYAPVSRLESIRILLAYAYALDFKLFQIDVKSAFLNGFINEEVVNRVMSSPSHPTSNIEDAFSSNFPDYIPASPDYVPASTGKTYSSSSNNSFGLVPIASPTISLFHDDPYIKVMHAYYDKESPILPPTIVPPSSMLSPMFNPQKFFLHEELLPLKKRGCDRSSSSTSALP